MPALLACPVNDHRPRAFRHALKFLKPPALKPIEKILFIYATLLSFPRWHVPAIAMEEQSNWKHYSDARPSRVGNSQFLRACA
jgi:hypothetical protein